ncbi:4'-phosphopantetheinyl transferase superfamily protein [Cohnella lubricantis]|uniref:4'-phosphopantetheinyl transferase superfamily protein n=1 Tax=Cohnella lubricantis TaxID=2163172 RepID=A0A841TBH4_9BACL|nr:4'-phosphopantetheinyl transferase superfamily protein [Cohnella lubricantis]
MVRLALPYVSCSRRRRIERLILRRAVAQTLLSELLVRYVAINSFRIGNEQIAFGFNPHQKPFVIGLPNFHYNISHSGDWVLCAVDTQPVGIDIERITSTDRDIALEYFAPDEQRYLNSAIGISERRHRFYEVWTKKESYVKAIGAGLSMPLHSFSVMDTEQNANCRFQFRLFDSNYAVSICAAHDEFPEQIAIKPVHQLLQLCQSGQEHDTQKPLMDTEAASRLNRFASMANA